VADSRPLLLTAIRVLSQWTLEQIVSAYRISETEGMLHRHPALIYP
jgi:hypothetical protein